MNIFEDLVLLDYLKNTDSLTYQNGGTSIGVSLEYAKNTTVQAMTYYTQLNTTPQKISQTAEYQWGMYGGTETISFKEKRQNAGPNIYNLMEAKARSLAKSMSDEINTDLYAAAAVTNGISTLVTNIDATSTIGIVNSTTQAFWQANVTASGSFAGQGPNDLETNWALCSSSNMKNTPNILITDQTTWGYYNLSLQPQIRYTASDQGNVSFQNLKYKTADFVWDTAATSGVIYLINTNAMKLYIDSGANFIMFEPERPTNQIADSSAMTVLLQLVITNRRRLGKLTGVTA